MINSIKSWLLLALLFAEILPCSHAFQHFAIQPHRSSRVYTTRCSLRFEGRLYRGYDEKDINAHVASLQKVRPEIKPDPLVLDEVEEHYPTQYETYRFFPKKRLDEITVSVRKTSFGCGKLGSALWRCGLALSCHLVSLFDIYSESELDSMRVVELGAGLGLASCVCREVGVGKVLATDFWEELTSFDRSLDKKRLIPHKLFGVNLEFNVKKSAGIASQRQHSDSIEVSKLDWGSEEDAFRTKVVFDPTLIIGSDVVYRSEDCPPLVRTLELLLGGESTTNTKVEAILFLDYNGRNDEDVDAFRVMIKDMVSLHSEWSLAEDELKLCYWMDDTGENFQQEYSMLEVTISNGK